MTTTLTLVVALGVLYGITKAFGQPITVALLGVVIAMLSSAVVNDPDPRQQTITLLAMPCRPPPRSPWGRCWRRTRSPGMWCSWR